MKTVVDALTAAALAGALLLAPGCSALLAPKREAPTLVLQQRSGWDAQVQRSLAKLGFKVVEKDDPAAADARYGLAVSFGPRLDYCLANEHEKYARVTYEVSDVKTRTVIASAQKPGWTGPCIIRWPTVFDELAEELAAVWESAIGR